MSRQISQFCKCSLTALLLSFSLNQATGAQSNESQDWSTGTINEPSFSLERIPNGGMTAFKILTRLATLSMFDNVLGYAPPVGPRIDFTSNYDYSEAQSTNKRDYSNLGAGWTLNWVAFLATDAKGNITINVPGGGQEFYPVYRKQNGPNYFKHNTMSHAVVIARPDGYERQLPDGSVEIYNQSGKNGRKYLSEIKDPSGNSAKISYDQWFRINAITDANGQSSQIKHMADTPETPGFFQISRIVDPFGREAKFAYSKDLSQLLSCTDPIGLESKYSYSSAKNASITALSTPYGTTKFQNYKPSGSPDGSHGLKVSHPDGTYSITEHWTGDRHATYQWNRIATALYPTDQQKADYSHCTVTKWLTEAGSGKELSIPASVKEPLESEVVYSYLGQGPSGFRGSSNLPASISRRVPIQNPDGSTGSAIQTYSYQYNRFGHTVRRVDPLGRTFSYLFALNDIDLHEVRQTRAGNNVMLSKLEYDSHHHLLRAFDASGNVTTFEYNKVGQLTKSTDANGATTKKSYDSNGRLIAIYGPLSDKHPLATMTYDKFGHVQSLTDVDGKTVIFEFDAADRNIKRQFEDGTSERITFDKLNAVSFQDRAGKTTKRAYDSLGRLTTIEDPAGRKSSYEWCLCGALRKLTDPAGHSTEWHHDIQGRVIQKKYANGSQITFEYEPDGHRLLTKTDALKQITKYKYALDDALIETKYENAVNPTSAVSLSYDPNYGYLVSAQNGLGKLNYDYYPNKGDLSGPSGGRLSSITNSAIPNSKISLEYDAVGQLIGQSINGDQNKLVLAYDQMGRLKSGTSVLGEFKYSYDDKNGATVGTQRLASIAYPNGASVRFEYGSSGQIGKIINSTVNGSKPICEFDYVYDNSGQISNWTQQFEGKTSAQYKFSYDPTGQLTSAVNEGTSSDLSSNFGFSYDRNSNRTVVTNKNMTQTSLYNEVNELQSTKDSAAEANQTQELKYDLNGNLLSDQTRTFFWDAEDRLVRINYTGSKNHTEFSYNSMGQLEKITEYSDTTQVSSKQLIWYHDRICEVRTDDGAKQRKIFSLGENIDGKNYYFCRDHLGSTRTVIDGAGKIEARLDYDPFGHSISDATQLADLQFAGYYMHAPSGLYLTLARAYDSKNGRWLSRDPLGELASGLDGPIEKAKDQVVASNLYAYVANNVTGRFDPMGLQYSNAQGSAVRQTVSDAGQNSNGRIWYISYAGQSQGVTWVNEAPTISNFVPAPAPAVQMVPLPAAPTGWGYAATMPSPQNGKVALSLLLILPNGMGVYGIPGNQIFVNPKTGQAWQILRQAYVVQDLDQLNGFSAGRIQCGQQGKTTHR